MGNESEESFDCRLRLVVMGSCLRHTGTLSWLPGELQNMSSLSVCSVLESGKLWEETNPLCTGDSPLDMFCKVYILCIGVQQHLFDKSETFLCINEANYFVSTARFVA